jgi:hypothetical protein
MGKKKKRIKIDKDNYEGYNYGPFTVERIGRVVKVSSHWEPGQFEKFKEKIKNERPKFKKAIDRKIDEVLSLIRQFEPFELLASVSIKNLFADPEEHYKEVTHERSECYAEYALALVLSQKRKEKLPSATKEAIDKFNGLLTEIFNDVLWYFGTENTEDKWNDIEEELRFTSIKRYLFERGDSYSEHHLDMVRDIFKSHDLFFEKHYGFNSNQFFSIIREIRKQLQNNLRQQTEIIYLQNELNELFKEFVNKEGQDSFSSNDDCYNKYFALPNVQEKKKKLDEIQHNIDRNPFEISPNKNIPLDLLKLLSSSFGDNSSFATLKQYPGWPTNDSIVYGKPLIENNGKYYCFSPQVLFRNTVNILEGWIQDKDGSYYQSTYQKKRAEYLENKALKYLKKILPRAKVFENLFYSITENGVKKRPETDGLILYDENLFIIEAKAGKYSTLAKRGSLKIMKQGVTKLIDSAYKQALRTKQYINDTPEPVFEYKDGSIAVILKDKEKYKNIYLLNITLQNLAQLSTRLNSLKSFNLIEGKEWPWSVFINDLRVISELIEFPSEFLHFLQRRIKANDYQEFYTTDELDFLMVYFREGLYFEDGLLKNLDRYIPSAYTEDLDRYYDYIAGRVSSGKKPKLKILKEYKNLITELESTSKEQFTKVTTTLLNCDGKAQKAILDNLNKVLNISKRDNHDGNFTMFFNDFGLTFLVSTNQKPDSWDGLNRYCRLKMYQRRIEEWILITVYIDKNGKRSLDFKIYNKKWEHDPDMEIELDKIKALKIEKFKKTGLKIGRNDPCPCGSGLKYKKCCGK